MIKTDRGVVLGEGERAELSSRRQLMTVKGALFTVGLFSGAYLGYALASNDYDLNAQWPSGIAIALAAVYLIAMAAGSFLLRNRIDEVERLNTYKAVAFAGSAYMVVYPVWFLLWKAALLPEPVHWLLFAGFWLALIGAALFYRFR